MRINKNIFDIFIDQQISPDLCETTSILFMMTYIETIKVFCSEHWLERLIQPPSGFFLYLDPIVSCSPANTGCIKLGHSYTSSTYDGLSAFLFMR